MAAVSFSFLCLSFLLPWVTLSGRFSFTLNDLYAILLGTDAGQKQVLQQALHQSASLEVFADTFVAIASILALYPVATLFSFASRYQRKTAFLSASSIMAITASLLAAYTSISLNMHLTTAFSFSMSSLRLASGPSLALLAGAILSLAYSTFTLRSKAETIPQRARTEPKIERILKSQTKPETSAQPKVPMMYCEKCGSLIPQKSKTCNECGAKIP